MTEVKLDHRDDGSTWVQIQAPDPRKEPPAACVDLSMWDHRVFNLGGDKVFVANEEGWYEEYVPRSQWKEAKDAFEKLQSEIETLQTQLTRAREVSYYRNQRLGAMQARAEQTERNLTKAEEEIKALHDFVLRQNDSSSYLLNSVDRFGEPHAYAINSDTITSLATELRELQILFEQMQTERNRAYENRDRYREAYGELKYEAIMHAQLGLLDLLTKKIVRLNEGLRE